MGYIIPESQQSKINAGQGKTDWWQTSADIANSMATVISIMNQYKQQGNTSGYEAEAAKLAELQRRKEAAEAKRRQNMIVGGLIVTGSLVLLGIAIYAVSKSGK